ncbi:hypothetical protein U1Q18_010803 [Sarracenia purpurea var. burkii]
MARFLLLCSVILAELSISMTETKGTEGLDLMARVAVFGHNDGLIPSPAPSSGGDNSGIRNYPGNRRVTRHHISDKSRAGGEVILGGFASALFAAVFCYIRVTRKSKLHTNAEATESETTDQATEA